MRKIILLSMLFISSLALAKNCDELVQEIKSKLDAKGVVNYKLDIIDSSAATELKIVGTCGGGKNKITYLRQ